MDLVLSGPYQALEGPALTVSARTKKYIPVVEFLFFLICEVSHTVPLRTALCIECDL